MSADLIILDTGELALAPGVADLLLDTQGGGCCCGDDGGSCDDCCNRVNSDGSKCCYVAAADGAGDVYVVNSGSMIIMTWWDYNSQPCGSGSPCPGVPAPCTLLSDTSKLKTTGYSRCSWTMTAPAPITGVLIDCPFPPMTIYREYVLFRGANSLCTTGSCSESPDDRSYSETVDVTSEISREVTNPQVPNSNTHWVSASVKGGYSIGSRGMCERVFGPVTTNCSQQDAGNQFRCSFGQRPVDDCYDIEVFIDTGCICDPESRIDHSVDECARIIYTHSLHINRSDQRCNVSCNACAN